MPPANKRLTYLLHRFADQTATVQEENEFFSIVAEDKHDNYFRQTIFQMLEEQEAKEMDKSRLDMILQKVLDKEAANVYHLSKKGRSFKFKTFAVAAIILGIICTASYFLFFNQEENKHNVATTIPAFRHDATPGTNVPQLILADGSIINLDSNFTGSIITDGGVKVSRSSNGEIIYDASYAEDEIQYNTINNPKGSKVATLALADGSKIWLNAASSIKYPTAFRGKKREVEIWGEAYFEVAHNASQTFSVRANGVEVQVLGTHFNVNGYTDEATINTTLLEGSVKVSNGSATNILKPGQQAQIDQTGNSIKITTPNIDEVMAWKNGRFEFNNADIKTIMRQVQRWYDVDVVYEGNIPHKEFTGKMSKNVKASQLLRILELSGIHFRIEDKQIIVMP